VKKNVVAWVALVLVLLSLVLNAIALGTISEQQSTIRGLEAQVGGLVVVQEAATRTDREIVNVLGDHAQILDGLVQNDVGITDILDRLISLVQQSH